MEAIGAVARRNGLRIIEDAAQAHGAVIGERRAGALGDVAAFSFYPGKNLGHMAMAAVSSPITSISHKRFGFYATWVRRRNTIMR